MKENLRNWAILCAMATTTVLFSCNNDFDVISIEKEKKQLTGQENDLGDTPEKETKPTVQQGTSLVRLSVSDSHLLYIDPQGQLFGLGDGEKLGLGEATFTPKTINDEKWLCVSAGYNASMLIREDGTLWGVGGNLSGELGNGTTDDVKIFTQIGTDNSWVKVALGYQHAIGLKKDGTLWGWGINKYGQIAGSDDSPSSTPRQIGYETDWADIAASNRQSFALKKDGTLWGWGHNNFGAIGTGMAIGMGIFQPTKIESDQKWVSIQAGIKVGAGIKEDGSLWVWGRNYHGELGNGSGKLDNDHDSNIPVKVSDGIWKKVSIGADHLLAIKNDGTLWSWGQNMFGELGNMEETGAQTLQNTPQQVGSDNNWTDVAAGHFVSFAQKADNSIFGWGKNRSQWLGTNQNAQKTPVKIIFQP